MTPNTIAAVFGAAIAVAAGIAIATQTTLLIRGRRGDVAVRRPRRPARDQ